MDQVMAAESSRDDGASAPPSSPCPKCGVRLRFQSGKRLQPYCRECHAVDRRARYTHKNRSRHCQKCGAKRTAKKDCTQCVVIRQARHGEQRLREQFPGFVEVLTAVLSAPACIRLFAGVYQNHRKGYHTRFPPPSALFAGLDASLDQRLIRERRDKDVVLCQALAQIPTPEQREFLELCLRDPIDAQRWASLPTWKRPIRTGDADDQQIWAFFTMQRLNMEQAASEAQPWSMASQGAQLPQMFGAIARLSPAGIKKLVLVMNAYGVALQYGRPLGDVTKKPW